MRWFRFNSIRSNIAASFVITVLLIIIIVSLIAYHLSLLSVRNTATAFTSELVSQVNTNIQSYITTMEDISKLVLNHRETKLYLQNKDVPTDEISEFLDTIIISRNDISSIAIFDQEGNYVTANSKRITPYVEIEDQEWNQHAQEAKGEIVISSSHVQQIFADEFKWVVSLSRQIKNNVTSEVLGTLLVDLNFQVINDIVSQIELGKKGYIFIVDENGKLVYHPQQQLIYSQLKTEVMDKVMSTVNGSFLSGEGREKKIYSVVQSNFGWKIIGVSYESELIDNRGQMQLSYLLLGLLSLIVALTVSYSVSKNLSRPIVQLQEHMKEVERGNFNIRVPVDSTKEIGRLARTFNLMVAQIKELMGQVVKEQEAKRKRELEALQAQINPHFLYNTLDSIIWMAEDGKNEEVINMTSALAKLFRTSISKGQEFVSFYTEIEHITNYLTIQKIRYRDKIEYTIDIDPGIKQYQTLKVLLQPIVENAIYHGIKNKYGTGHIHIVGRKQNNNIVIKVIDNGVGMDEETLKQFTNMSQAKRSGKGYGIVNVHERICLYFGNQYGLKVESEMDVGTTVTLTFAAWEISKTQEGEEKR